MTQGLAFSGVFSIFSGGVGFTVFFAVLVGVVLFPKIRIILAVFAVGEERLEAEGPAVGRNLLAFDKAGLDEAEHGAVFDAEIQIAEVFFGEAHAAAGQPDAGFEGSIGLTDPVDQGDTGELAASTGHVAAGGRQKGAVHAF